MALLVITTLSSQRVAGQIYGMFFISFIVYSTDRSYCFRIEDKVVDGYAPVEPVLVLFVI